MEDKKLIDMLNNLDSYIHERIDKFFDLRQRLEYLTSDENIYEKNKEEAEDIMKKCASIIIYSLKPITCFSDHLKEHKTFINHLYKALQDHVNNQEVI